MTENKIQSLCPDKKRIDRNRIYDYGQWLERFRQYTSRKNTIDIRLLIKNETQTGAEWTTKEDKKQKAFFWALGPKGTHQKPRPEY